MSVKIKNIWNVLFLLICLSTTGIGKQLVKNILFLYRILFSSDIPLEFVFILYRFLIMLFIIISIIRILNFTCKKFKRKSIVEIDLEFKQIIENERLRNIWVLGPWGSGKTKFVKTSLEQLGKKYFYISLFGLSTRKDIIQEINEQVTQASKFSVIVELPVIGYLFKWLFQINGLSSLRNFNKNWIVVLDDFERVSNVYRKEISNKIELDSYNDVLGVIDYLQQSFSCKILVISSGESIKELLEEVVIPKFHPYQYHIKFDPSIIKDFPRLFFKKNDLQEIKLFSEIFSKIWERRLEITSLTNYRPIIHELSFLSDESDNRFKVSYVLSRLVDCWEIKIPSGSMIPFHFLVDRIKRKDSETVKYNFLKNMIKNSKFDNGLPYYVPENSKEKLSTKFEVQEVLVYLYMHLGNSASRIPNDYVFDDSEILLLTSQNPMKFIQGREIRDWVSENYIKYKYTNPTMSYKNILTFKYQKKWKEIYQASVAHNFVRDNNLDIVPELTSIIINTLERFEFLTENLDKLEEVLDTDYVCSSLLTENLEESLIASRILYRFLSQEHKISGNISLYLITSYLKYKRQISLVFDEQDLLMPVIIDNTSNINSFKNSSQYVFDKLLIKLKNNNYLNQKYKDEKILDDKDFTIYKEHALFIVTFLETEDKINGKYAKEYIREFIANNRDERKELLTPLVKMAIEYEGQWHTRKKPIDETLIFEDDELIDIEYCYESLSERYNRWIKILNEFANHAK